MSFVYAKVASLKDKAKVGSHQCVALVRHHAWPADEQTALVVASEDSEQRTWAS